MLVALFASRGERKNGGAVMRAVGGCKEIVQKPAEAFLHLVLTEPLPGATQETQTADFVEFKYHRAQIIQHALVCVGDLVIMGLGGLVGAIASRKLRVADEPIGAPHRLFADLPQFMGVK